MSFKRFAYISMLCSVTLAGDIGISNANVSPLQEVDYEEYIDRWVSAIDKSSLSKHSIVIDVECDSESYLNTYSLSGSLVRANYRWGASDVAYDYVYYFKNKKLVFINSIIREYPHKSDGTVVYDTRKLTIAGEARIYYMNEKIYAFSGNGRIEMIYPDNEHEFACYLVKHWRDKKMDIHNLYKTGVLGGVKNDDGNGSLQIRKGANKKKNHQ